MVGHSRVPEVFAELPEPALEQRGDGGRAPVEVPADLGQRPALAVLEQQRLALRLGQLGQGLHQQHRLLVPLGPLAGRRLLGGQPGVEPGGGLLDRLLERAFQRHVATAAAVVADGVGQGAGEDPPEPGRQLGRGPSPRNCAEGLVRLQERLLHDVGRIQLAPQGRAELEPGQDAQVVPVPFQLGRVVIRPSVPHRAPPLG